MKHINRVGYLGIVSILLLTLIPFASRIASSINSPHLSTPHCHQTTLDASTAPNSTNHQLPHAKHKTNPDSWTSMCDYCELFMQVPVLIYVNVPIVKIFISVTLVKNHSPEFVKVYRFNSHHIRAPPLV